MALRPSGTHGFRSEDVAATDRGIVVFSAKPFSQTTPRSAAMWLPRETRLGPVHGTMGIAELKVKIEGRPILAQRRFDTYVE